MGISGLYTWLVQQGAGEEINLTKEIKKKSTPYYLIVDGNGLVYHLYYTSKLESNHGGQYKDFELEVKDFIQTLRKNNIHLKVIFDGALEEEKLSTKLKRLRSAAEESTLIFTSVRQHRIPQIKFCPYFAKACLSVVYLTKKKVLESVLRSEGIECQMSPEEADSAIAALTVQLSQSYPERVAVLARDSDFLIYPVRYFPLDTFRWRQTSLTVTSFTNSQTAAALRLHPKVFNPTISQEYLPLLAALVGNDFTPPSLIEKLQRELGIASHQSLQKIQNVSLWISSQLPSDTFKDFLPPKVFYGRSERWKALKMLYNVQRRYIPRLSDWKAVADICPPCQLSSFRESLANNRIDNQLWNILLRKKYFPRSVPLDYSQWDSVAFVFCKSLRKCFYRILFSTEKEVSVIEYLPREGILKPFEVSPMEEDLPSLSELFSSSLELRQKIFFEIFDMTSELLLQLPSKFLFISIASRFWLSNKHSLRSSDIDTLICLSLHLSGLSPFTQTITTHSIDIPLQARSLHIGSQFQIVMDHVLMANQICGFPFEEISPSQFFDGKLWSAIYDYLEGKELEDYKDEIWENPEEGLELLNQIREGLLKGLDTTFAIKGKKKKKKKKTKEKTKTSANRFDLLQISEPEFE